jgi:hypothetical protein
MEGGLAEEMLAIAKTITFPEPRAVALAAVASRLSQPQRNSVLSDALTIARAGSYRSGETLAGISRYFPEPERTAVLAEALAACESDRSEYSKTMALAKFAANLEGSLAERALRALFEVAGKIERRYLLNALTGLVPAISRVGGADAVESLRRATIDTAAWYP